MEESTVVLLRYQDSCPNLSRSLADQIQGMHLNDIPSIYADFRSPSRAAHQTFRKRRTPTPCWKRCHTDFVAHSHCHTSRRRRRAEEWVAECNAEAYLDKQVVEQEQENQVECMDLIQMYYNYGRNATVLESIQPTYIAGDDQEEEADVYDWVSVNPTTDVESEVEVVTTPLWTLYLYRPPASGLRSLIAENKFVSLGACTFTWHRNASGCWELGYANQYILDEELDPYGCKQTPLPITCHCCTPNFGVYACSCAAFAASWPSLEGPWCGYLLDWMSYEAWNAMKKADVMLAAMREGGWKSNNAPRPPPQKEINISEEGEEWTFVSSVQTLHLRDVEWDVVSSLSSTGSWRAVDVGRVP